jgi:hypothetical protein
VLSVIKPQAFWNWFKWKILQTWPRRNYLRGGLTLGDDIRTPTLNRFNNWYYEQTKAIVKIPLIEERREMRDVEGMYDDTYGFMDSIPIIKKVIMGNALNRVLQDERIQKIDLALEKIMKNGNGKGSKKGKAKVEPQPEIEDEDDYDEDYDGNEWYD